MSSHGKWNSLYSNGCRPYLKAADRILNSGGSGYHFVFGLENNGVSIEYTEGEILSVDVCGSKSRRTKGGYRDHVRRSRSKR